MKREISIEGGCLVVREIIAVRIPLRFVPSGKTLRRMVRTTPREMQMLDLVLAGKVNKEIATALGVSVSTVKQCVSGLLRKFAVSSRQDLILLGVHRWPSWEKR